MVELKNIEFYKNSDDNWKEEKINGRIMSIPNDWLIDILNNISTFRRGSFPQPYGLEQWYDDINGKPFIQVCDIQNDKIKNQTKKRISLKAEPFSLKVLPGTIVLTIQGTIGKIAIIEKESFVDRTLLIFQNINENINKKYFLKNIKTLFEVEEKKADGGVIKSINKEKLSKFIVKLPNTIKEQEKIASILETQENLIDSKKELLEKYKKQRKYFQQELLSGRIRIKLNNKSIAEAFELGLIKQTFLNDANEVVEYGGDTITNVNIDIIDKDAFESWLSIDFENKIEFYKNIDFKEEKINGRNINIPNDWFIENLGSNNLKIIKSGINKFNGTKKYYATGDVLNNKLSNSFELIEYIKRPNRANMEPIKNSIFFAKMKDTIKHLKFKEPNKEIILSTGFQGIEVINYNLNYIFYNLNKIEIIKNQLSTGSTQLGVNDKITSIISITIPNNLIEQTLIGEQLTKIDNLIESLEEEIKLENKKLTYLKQELLSGRIRVN